MKNIISYQGVNAAYSHLACKNAFPNLQTLACKSFLEAMQNVRDEKSEFAMIPLENSTAGRVEEVYRLIPEMNLQIVGEHFERVRHCLLCLPEASIKDIKVVASHPQALAQCHQNILNLNLEPRVFFDTAGSAKNVTESKDVSLAAIASKMSAKLYNLKILHEDFGDNFDNFTRFLVLSKTKSIPKFIANKNYITSLIFGARDIPASLYKALGGFATNKVNLLKLESYSKKGTLELGGFHLDIHGHIHEKAMQLALEELGFFANDIKILGVYEANSYRKL